MRPSAGNARGFAFPTLATVAGLNLVALDAACAPFGAAPITSLAGYQECLRRSHACGAAELIAAEAPRAAQLLGVVGRSLRDGFCPVP